MTHIVGDNAKSGDIAVSVCIANYNGIGLIDGCIASVRAQVCDLAVEIVVHDDASIDGSAQHVRERHSDVHLIESGENVGFCIANNRMAAVARGTYLLLLNNDATLLPDALATLYREAEHLRQPAVLSLPQYDADSGDLLDIGSLLDPFFNVVPNRDPQRSDVGMVAGACLWVPKKLWGELGGFPEWFGSIAEDLYLCCRVRLAGYPVRVLGVSGYRHGVGTSFGGGKLRQGRLVTTRRRRALSERNKTFVMVLCCPTVALCLALPLHLGLLMLEGAVLAIIKRQPSLFTDIYFASLLSLWRERKRLRTLRQEIWRQSRMSCRQFFSVFRWFPHKASMLLRHGVPKLD